MQKSEKLFNFNNNQMPEVQRFNQFGQRFYRMTRMKPVFSQQRTRTWKNKSRSNFSYNRMSVPIKNRKEATTPTAILGTKRADELIAAQHEQTIKSPLEYSRPILGRKYSTQTAVHCCEKCAQNAILNVKIKNQAMDMVKGNDLESEASIDAGENAANSKIRTMTFTNKVGMPKEQQPLALPTKFAPVISINVKQQPVFGMSTSMATPAATDCYKQPTAKETPYDICSVLRYALKIMRSESTGHVDDEINSTDSQKLMAVHKRLLSMAIWNNNEEIFDEYSHEVNADNVHNTSEQHSEHTAKPDSVILNSCVFFANGKSLIAPPASALPMPPKQWILDQIANDK